jgi:hypothetical protein
MDPVYIDGSPNGRCQDSGPNAPAEARDALRVCASPPLDQAEARINNLSAASAKPPAVPFQSSSGRG